MKVHIVSLGTQGDVNPLLYLAEALKRQGDDVTFILNPVFREMIESKGFRAVTPGEPIDTDRYIKENPNVTTYKGAKALIEETVYTQIPVQYEAVTNLSKFERPDLIVSHFLCYGSEWAADDLGIKHVSIVFSPLTLFSSDDPSYSLYGFRFVPRKIRGLMIKLGKRIHVLESKKELNKIASDMKLVRKDRSFFESKKRSALMLALWSDNFRGSVPDDPENLESCNFSWPLDSSDEITSHTEKFLEKNDEPIVVGLGTSARNIAGDIYEIIARVCDKLGIPCVLIGVDDVKKFDRFSCVHATRYEPFEKIFSRSSIVIHHGGVSTMATAFRSGKPSLIIPFMFDQFDNALRAVDLGLARSIHKDIVCEELIENEIRVIMNSARFASVAKKFGERMQLEENGALQGARMLKKICFNLY